MLWFEADLYDQLQLAQILAMLHALGVAAARVTLICIGEHLGFAHFGGLGELSSEQLGRLPGTAATTLTPAALEHAARAWAALRASDPTSLRAIAATPSAELRFLGEAFDRLGREYPSTRDGLSLTERRILAAVTDGAPDAGAAFVRAAAREARPFLGDTWGFDRMTARFNYASLQLLFHSPEREGGRTSAREADETVASAESARGGLGPRGEGQSEVALGSGRWCANTAAFPDVRMIETALAGGTVARGMICAGLSEHRTTVDYSAAEFTKGCV